MYILAIETSCDETSIALLENNKVKKCLIWSQIKHFEKYGGVVPNIASELHSENLPILLNQLITEFPNEWEKIDYIAYTTEPGLVGCLRVGQAFAETIAFKKKKPLIKINHLHAHLYAGTLTEKFEFPVLGLVVSGGHTQIYYLAKELNFQLIGETFDDAAGEFLDKIGRKMGLGYPAGAKIEKLAINGTPKYNLNIYQNKKNFDFSFSGVKTHALQIWEKIEKTKENIRDFAASLQKTMIDVLVKKIKLASEKYPVKTIVLGGGVAANKSLEQKVKSTFKIKIIIPAKIYCTDNAAMVGILAYFQIINSLKVKKD